MYVKLGEKLFTLTTEAKEKFNSQSVVEEDFRALVESELKDIQKRSGIGRTKQSEKILVKIQTH